MIEKKGRSKKGESDREKERETKREIRVFGSLSSHNRFRFRVFPTVFPLFPFSFLFSSDKNILSVLSSFRSFKPLFDLFLLIYSFLFYSNCFCPHFPPQTHTTFSLPQLGYNERECSRNGICLDYNSFSIHFVINNVFFPYFCSSISFNSSSIHSKYCK